MVNRVWQHLLGRGIVQSVDNFGVMGDSPSHPELLDHLATRFIRDGWSIKRLIRTIALSRTYRLSAESVVAQSAVDPANRYLWRHLPRRLAAEEIRDAMLATAGNLSSARPEGSPAANLKVIELRDTAPDAKRMLQAARDDVHRSIYLPLLRGLTPPALEVFDFAEQSLVTGSRDETTVPTQALYLLNDAFVHQQSRLLAERVLAEDRDAGSDAVNRLYRLTLGRDATAPEIARSQRFVADYESASRSEPLSIAAVKKPLPHVDKSSETTVAATTSTITAKPVVDQNPDNVSRSVEVNAEPTVEPLDPRTAAWTAFCQALFSSAEFRYLK